MNLGAFCRHKSIPGNDISLAGGLETVNINETTRQLTQPLQLLSPRETAKLLGISEKTLFTYTQRGDIPVMRIGRSVRYSLDHLRAWIDSRIARIDDSDQNRA
jgi:excisionase family DNA binding protein